jgi:hypothetical protein
MRRENLRKTPDASSDRARFNSAYERVQSSGENTAFLLSEYVSGMEVSKKPLEQQAPVIPEMLTLATSKGLHVHSTTMKTKAGTAFYLFLSKKDTLTQEDWGHLVIDYFRPEQQAVLQRAED